jgi:hypothetical protein
VELEFVVSIVDTVFRSHKDYFALTISYVMFYSKYIDALGN